MQAYKVTLKGWDLVVICAASTRGKAIAQCNNQAQDAGYKIPWVDFRATRAPQYDSAAQAQPNRIIGWRQSGLTMGVLWQQRQSSG